MDTTEKILSAAIVVILVWLVCEELHRPKRQGSGQRKSTQASQPSKQVMGCA